MRPIDADELKKPVGSYNPVKWTSEYGFVISVEDIDHAPTIAPVKHGQWEWIGGYGYQYRCSECIMCAERTTNYCPNCGASMDAFAKDIDVPNKNVGKMNEVSK